MKEEKWYVYMHIIPNGKRYIGITSQEPYQRFGKDGNGYRTQFFYRAIKKYGWRSIQHEILFKGVTKEFAELKEIELIKLYKTNELNYGYNVQMGGGSHGKHSQATKEKLRAINSGKKLSEETKQKMSISRTGRKVSEETKRKIGLAHSGENNHMYHKKWSKEHNEYMSKIIREKAKKRKVKCIENDRIYNSISDASRDLNIPHQNIVNVCQGKRITAKGYRFKYA